MLRHSFNVVVANSFSCAQTKTILGGTFAPYFLAKPGRRNEEWILFTGRSWFE